MLFPPPLSLKFVPVYAAGKADIFLTENCSTSIASTAVTLPLLSTSAGICSSAERTRLFTTERSMISASTEVMRSVAVNVAVQNVFFDFYVCAVCIFNAVYGDFGCYCRPSRRFCNQLVLRNFGDRRIAAFKGYLGRVRIGNSCQVGTFADFKGCRKIFNCNRRPLGPSRRRCR